MESLDKGLHGRLVLYTLAYAGELCRGVSDIFDELNESHVHGHREGSAVTSTRRELLESIAGWDLKAISQAAEDYECLHGCTIEPGPKNP